MDIDGTNSEGAGEDDIGGGDEDGKGGSSVSG